MRAAGDPGNPEQLESTMSKHYLLRSGLAIALIFGSLASTMTSSYSATTSSSAGNQGSRGSSNPGGPAGGNPGGGGGSGAGIDAIIIKGNCRVSLAAIGCNPRPRPLPAKVINTAEPQRCSNHWRLVELADGTIVEDRSEPMRKNCRIIRAFD
jgi:hypothetical protein